MNIRCIIIDDEHLALDLLEDNINKIPFLELKAKFRNALEALNFIQQHQVDLIISDIQMPSLSGLQLVESLPNCPMVIFTTAYENYAVQSFEINVVDYLVKPFSFERFLLASNKALELHKLKNNASRKNEINAATDYFYVNADYIFIKVQFQDILFIQGLKDYVKINFKDTRKPLVTRMTMKNIELILHDKDFIRIHKSYIVADDAITAIKKNFVFLGNIELPLGNSFKEKIEMIVNRKL
jgi:DNA-binding LytR/AlgR family response regulator